MFSEFSDIDIFGSECLESLNNDVKNIENNKVVDSDYVSYDNDDLGESDLTEIIF